MHNTVSHILLRLIVRLLRSVGFKSEYFKRNFNVRMAASDVEVPPVTNMLEAFALRTPVPSIPPDNGLSGGIVRDKLMIENNGAITGVYPQDGGCSSVSQGIPLHRSNAFLSALWFLNNNRPLLGNFGTFVTHPTTTASKEKEETLKKCNFARKSVFSKRNNRSHPYPSSKEEYMRQETKFSNVGSKNDRNSILTSNKNDLHVLKSTLFAVDTSYSPLYPFITNRNAVLAQLGMNKSVVTGCSEKQTARTFNFRYLTSNEGSPNVLSSRDIDLQKHVRNSLKSHGICVIDRLLGDEIGTKIKSEMVSLHANRNCTKGELLGRRLKKNVRGDIITWADGSESDCVNLRALCTKMDAIVATGGGVTEGYNICGGTKAMVARYPGNGTRYQLHVDNPAKDGRCLTCIYYLNKNWDANEMGGNLRFHAKTSGKTAKISPDFDRIVIFYSDSRNPHEVLPTYANRYAVTLWYFDREERAKAIEKFVKDN